MKPLPSDNHNVDEDVNVHFDFSLITDLTILSSLLTKTSDRTHYEFLELCFLLY